MTINYSLILKRIICFGGFGNSQIAPDRRAAVRDVGDCNASWIIVCQKVIRRNCLLWTRLTASTIKLDILW